MIDIIVIQAIKNIWVVIYAKSAEKMRGNTVKTTIEIMTLAYTKNKV